MGMGCSWLKWRRAGGSDPVPEGTAVYKTAPVARQSPSDRVTMARIASGQGCCDSGLRVMASRTVSAVVRSAKFLSSLGTPQRRLRTFPQQSRLTWRGIEIRLDCPWINLVSCPTKPNYKKSGLSERSLFEFSSLPTIVSHCKRLSIGRAVERCGYLLYFHGTKGHAARNQLTFWSLCLRGLPPLRSVRMAAILRK